VNDLPLTPKLTIEAALIPDQGSLTMEEFIKPVD
jgi:hypothetical protein